MKIEEIEKELKVRVNDEKFNVVIKEKVNDEEVRCEWFSTENVLQTKIFNIIELSVINKYFSLKWKR